MAKGTIIAFHGWGFNANCWDIWKEYLSPDYRFLAFERGYFSAESSTPSFPPQSSVNIIFSHSYGLHLCSEEILEQADMLFIFGGFKHFHPVAAQFKRRSKMVLNQMIDRFEENPRHVLKEFYVNTFNPQDAHPLPEGEPNLKLLKNDLVKLGKSKFEPGKLKSVDKIGILHGFNDGIVPRAKGRELYDDLKSKGKYFEIKQCGHGLSFTHTEQCWSLIEPEIEQYLKHE